MPASADVMTNRRPQAQRARERVGGSSRRPLRGMFLPLFARPSLISLRSNRLRDRDDLFAQAARSAALESFCHASPRLKTSAHVPMRSMSQVISAL